MSGYTPKRTGGDGGGGSGGSDGLDVSYPSEAATDSSPRLRTDLPSEVSADTDLRVKPVLRSEVSTDTALDSVALEANWPSTVRTSNAFSMDVYNLSPAGDTWVGEAAPNATHGSDTLLQVQQGVIAVQDGARAWILFDLTSLGQGQWWADPGQPWPTLELYLSPPAVDIAATLTVRARVYTGAQPWDAATLTWNNQPDPATHTVVGTYSYPLLAGPGAVQIPLDDSSTTHVDTLTDDPSWLSVVCTFEALVAIVGTFTVRSKEHGTGPAPNLSFRAVSKNSEDW